jgi:hypothetical protein
MQVLLLSKCGKRCRKIQIKTHAFKAQEVTDEKGKNVRENVREIHGRASRKHKECYALVFHIIPPSN